MKRKSIRQHFAFIILAVILGTLVAGCSNEDGSSPFFSHQEVYGEEVERWIDAEGIHRIDVTTENGAIEATGVSAIDGTGGGGDPIYIYARKEIGAPSLSEAEEFAGKVEIRTIRDGDRIRVFSDYPDPPQDIEVSVSFEIESPPQIDLTLLTVNGTCRIDGMIGEVRASTTNGSVVADMVELTGDGIFTTVNGSVDVGIREGIGALTGTAINGSVVLTLHSGFGGVLNAQTVHGEIACHFPIYNTGYNTPNHLTGIIGPGGSTPVVLSTVNGNIDLNRF